MKNGKEFGYIDIHTHMMYDADDGAADINETKAMLHLAIAEGIRCIVLTPHYHESKYRTAPEILLQRYEEIKTEARQLSSNMQIYLGNELFYSESLIEDLKGNKCFTLNGTSYILVEFHPKQNKALIRRSLHNLLSAGYLPILAHTERYEELQRDLDDLLGLKQMGVVLQVNADSITGKGNRHRFVKKLLKKELADIVSTDCHNNRLRPPLMMTCASYLEKKYGYQYAYLLCCGNALRILNGEYIN